MDTNDLDLFSDSIILSIVWERSGMAPLFLKIKTRLRKNKSLLTHKVDGLKKKIAVYRLYDTSNTYHVLSYPWIITQNIQLATYYTRQNYLYLNITIQEDQDNSDLGDNV